METELKLFPNPAHEKISILFYATKGEKYKLQIMDFVGKILINTDDIGTDGENKLKLTSSVIAEGKNHQTEYL